MERSLPKSSQASAVSRHDHQIRNAIVTGSAAGVGRAIAQRFARAGDRVDLIVVTGTRCVTSNASCKALAQKLNGNAPMSPMRRRYSLRRNAWSSVWAKLTSG
jgi:hypothetical protein